MEYDDGHPYCSDDMDQFAQMTEVDQLPSPSSSEAPKRRDAPTPVTTEDGTEGTGQVAAGEAAEPAHLEVGTKLRIPQHWWPTYQLAEGQHFWPATIHKVDLDKDPSGACLSGCCMCVCV